MTHTAGSRKLNSDELGSSLTVLKPAEKEGTGRLPLSFHLHQQKRAIYSTKSLERSATRGLTGHTSFVPVKLTENRQKVHAIFLVSHGTPASEGLATDGLVRNVFLSHAD